MLLPHPCLASGVNELKIVLNELKENWREIDLSFFGFLVLSNECSLSCKPFLFYFKTS